MIVESLRQSCIIIIRIERDKLRDLAKQYTHNQSYIAMQGYLMGSYIRTPLQTLEKYNHNTKVIGAMHAAVLILFPAV